MFDQRLGAGQLGARLEQRCFQRILVVRKTMISYRRHDTNESQIKLIRRLKSATSVDTPPSTCRLWTPTVKRMAPIDSFQQITELRRCYHHRAVRGLWPDEPAALQP